MSTIKDVAQCAGLSPSCVSKYFKDRNSVRLDTRRRIEEAVSSLNYVPSNIARFLRNGKSMTLKAIMPSITRPFFASIFEYLHTLCRTAGYNILLQTIEENESFSHGDFVFADGVIVAFPDDDRVVNQLTDILIEMGKPLSALLGHENARGCAIISVDICRDMAEAATYLLTSGRKRIAYVGGANESSPSRERWRGFSSVIPPELRHGIYQQAFSLEWGYFAAQKMLLNEIRPDSVLCENDSIAAGVIKCFLSNGVTVPNDVWVVGYDNTILSEMYSPSISSVSIPSKEMSEEAVRILLGAINGKPLQNSKFRGKLIIRESSC